MQSTGFPYVQIVEQPAKCGVRFRYECEGRISGAIPGSRSTPSSPTFPAIRLIGHTGSAKVVVSCVTKNPPFRPHPHNLVGKKSCRDGVCSLVFDGPVCVFNNLGILCAKRKDIRDRLRLRESLRVDPFRTGFSHRGQAFKVIDLAVVRLAFQVWIEAELGSGDYCLPLEPVVSEPIYDKKAMSELAIGKLSHCSAPVTGGQEVILLCDRVVKDDIQVRFYEETADGILVWEAYAEFRAQDIHKHFAISFRTPRYADTNVLSPVAVAVQLRRPSDGQMSESMPFWLTPVRSPDTFLPDLDLDAGLVGLWEEPTRDIIMLE
ncbi:embryonic polarity protein dorsal-like [Oppia nitens]|uniref:embryonic polarity protein dorsal-like n=1 Tax=Oppia nitens TaxID=1686743 RepID=UPI0023DA4597|nr:embryonic polarity protein dorsal-like [Oppia nitens]